MNPMSVSHFSLLFVLASLLLQSSVVRSDAGLIQSTCAKTPFPALCISALSSSPKGATADVPHLGLIMVDVLTEKANAAINAMKQLIGTKPDLAKALNHCVEVYYDGILESDIPMARQAFSSGDYKFAEQGGNDAALEARSCESGFAQGQSPVTAKNKDVQDVAAVLAAIAKQLL